MRLTHIETKSATRPSVEQLVAEMRRTEPPGTVWFKLCCHGLSLQHSVVAFLCVDWRDVSDGLEESSVVEPAYPFQRRKLNGVERSPGSPPMDDFGFVEAVDRLGERIV